MFTFGLHEWSSLTNSRSVFITLKCSRPYLLTVSCYSWVKSAWPFSADTVLGF